MVTNKCQFIKKKLEYQRFIFEINFSLIKGTKNNFATSMRISYQGIPILESVRDFKISEFRIMKKVLTRNNLALPKDWGPKKVTFYFPIFYLVKSS